MLLRRFHAEVRRLISSCKQSGFSLYSYNEADSDYVCVLSMSDYEIDCTKDCCDEDTESYFLCPQDYEKYREKYGYEY